MDKHWANLKKTQKQDPELKTMRDLIASIEHAPPHMKKLDGFNEWLEAMKEAYKIKTQPVYNHQAFEIAVQKQTLAFLRIKAAELKADPIHTPETKSHVKLPNWLK